MSAVPARAHPHGRRVLVRLLPISAYVGAILVVWFIVAHGLGSSNESSGTTPIAAVVVHAPRPASVPKHVPAWAYALYRWHSTPAAQRGRRPHGVPRPIPDWYWAWRGWRRTVTAQR